MEDVFVGSAALASGLLTRGQLRWNYRALFPDVYVAKGATPHLAQRIRGAWLWSGKRAVIAGLAAAVLHGARIDTPIIDVELIWANGRPPRGIVARNERINPDEVVQIAGLPVTSAERTALDIARHSAREKAVVHLDALARATAIVTADIDPLLDRYWSTRGCWQAWESLRLMDGGALTPHETLTRLALLDAGFPFPRTDFMIAEGSLSARLAMGYDGPRVGVAFDASELLPQTGWTVIRAGKLWPAGIVNLVCAAVMERGYSLPRLRRRTRD